MTEPKPRCYTTADGNVAVKTVQYNPIKNRDIVTTKFYRMDDIIKKVPREFRESMRKDPLAIIRKGKFNGLKAFRTEVGK
jgi:hypothetical protein